MAVTRIHAIKATVQKAIKYICNPAKTDGELLVSTFGCDAKTAHHDFEYELSKTSGRGDIKAFHLIQSFAPGEVSFDEAHRIGTELASRLLEGKYCYVLATHIDHGHYHNHIIFCAADNIEHKKYNSTKASYRHIRNLSDELCAEHGLSVIEPSGRKGKSHAEWEADKSGTSWKSKLKNDMDEAIRAALSYENFIELMRAKGYDVKGEALTSDALKCLSFKAPGQTRWTRVSVHNFGAGYTKEDIAAAIWQRVEKDREDAAKASDEYARHKATDNTDGRLSHSKTIEQLTEKISRKQARIIGKYDTATGGNRSRKLIDISAEKFQNSPGLMRWAKLQNLKIVATEYAASESFSALEKTIAEKEALAKTARATIIQIEHELKSKAEILKYAQQYLDNRKYNYRYGKSKDPDTYYRSHEGQLILYDGAMSMLRRNGINPSKLDASALQKIQEEYAALSARKEDLKAAYKTAGQEAAKARKQMENVHNFVKSSPILSEQKNEPHSHTL